MKQISLLIAVLFFSGALYAQDSGCSAYHRGKFSYTDSTGATIIVKRKKNFQLETNEQTGVWVNFRITWINDCEYQLEQVGTNSKSKRKWNHTVTTTVISKPLGDAGYEYTCACKDDVKPKITGVMRVITIKN